MGSLPLLSAVAADVAYRLVLRKWRTRTVPMPFDLGVFLGRNHFCGGITGLPRRRQSRRRPPRCRPPRCRRPAPTVSRAAFEGFGSVASNFESLSSEASVFETSESVSSSDGPTCEPSPEVLSVSVTAVISAVISPVSLSYHCRLQSGACATCGAFGAFACHGCAMDALLLTTGRPRYRRFAPTAASSPAARSWHRNSFLKQKACAAAPRPTVRQTPLVLSGAGP